MGGESRAGLCGYEGNCEVLWGEVKADFWKRGGGRRFDYFWLRERRKEMAVWTWGGGDGKTVVMSVGKGGGGGWEVKNYELSVFGRGGEGIVSPHRKTELYRKREAFEAGFFSGGAADSSRLKKGRRCLEAVDQRRRKGGKESWVCFEA